MVRAQPPSFPSLPPSSTELAPSFAQAHTLLFFFFDNRMSDTLPEKWRVSFYTFFRWLHSTLPRSSSPPLFRALAPSLSLAQLWLELTSSHLLLSLLGCLSRVSSRSSQLVRPPSLSVLFLAWYEHNKKEGRRGTFR